MNACSTSSRSRLILDSSGRDFARSRSTLIGSAGITGAVNESSEVRGTCSRIVSTASDSTFDSSVRLVMSSLVSSSIAFSS